MFDYRRYVPAAILLAGCAFVWNARSQKAVPLKAPLSTIMPSMAGYTVTNQTLTADEARVAGMTTYMARFYQRDSTHAFSTFVSYYERQTQGKTIHSPKNCLPGAGWEVLSNGTANVMIDGVPRTLNRYLLKNGASMAVVYYWYQGRGRIVANEYRVKWNLLHDAAVAGHTEEALVRVVVPVAPTKDANGAAEATRRLAEADSVGVTMAAQLGTDVTRVLPGA